MARPFDTAAEIRASRYYPYGTTGRGEYLLHHGVDIGNPMGTPVLAVANGKVVYAGTDDKHEWGPSTDFYGQLVVLQHDLALDGRPLATLYGHVSRVLVRAGQSVRAGDPVAEVGAEGIALGPHLHLEVRAEAADYESTRNPELFLRPLDGHGTIVGRALDRGGRPVPGARIGLYAPAGDQPGEWLGETTTYPDAHVNATSPWSENFVFADAPAGRYVLAGSLDGSRVTAVATVAAGQAVVVTLRAGAAPAGTRGTSVPPPGLPPARRPVPSMAP
jgi:murein DD-endopeptidase MepM/ murein hydrolase activator NlpD